MKTRPRFTSLHYALLPFAATLLLAIPELAYSQLKQPVIASIHAQGTNLIVVAALPASIKRVVLEGRSRLGSGAWVPVAVTQLAGTGSSVTFTVPCTQPYEMLRVRADAQTPLPATFYAGAHTFSGPPTNNVAPPGGLTPGGGLTSGGATFTPQDGQTRSVVESDIWELSGDTLYFFNQYRGLQVIDISNPDAAVVRGTLELPAAGEQMYALDTNHVALLAASGCAYNTDQSEVLIVGVTNGLPQAVTNLPITGWIQESRLVGTALYIASQFYRPVLGSSNTWEWGTMVSSFNLVNPNRPAARGTLWYPGYGNVVTATDTYLFVVTEDPTNWWQSIVQIIDITSPDGTMAAFTSIQTAGQVSDKFKLNYANAVFTAISEDWYWDSTGQVTTKLETFNLPDPRAAGPDAVMKLGELDWAEGEQLMATRFDGDLVYVTTSLQIDPLWIVDLSQPANPQLVGSVKVPGWSTYLQPLGSQLVTVGILSNRVAVSLFDVHDPANPATLTQLLLGQNYSWSDATSDEKAFTVLPNIGLILVPYSGDTTNGWTSQVQLIDLTSSNLVARGIINHQTQSRRAAFSHKRVLSLSGWELLSVDATDRDHPVISGDTELAWSADRLFLQGNFLLQLTESTGWWGYQTPATVRVTPATDPNQIVGELPLGTLPIVGAGVRDGRLYVAQSPTIFYPWPTGGPGGGTNDTPTNNFFVTIVDLGNLPQLSILGQVAVAADVSGWGEDWQPVWPKPDVLVFAGGGRSFWWLAPALGPLAGPGGLPGGATGMLWPIWGFGGGQLLAFDVSDPTAPKFDSEVNLATNNWWSFSQPFSTGTLIYLSHTSSEWIPDPPDPYGTWLQQSFLDVIDYADPLSPTLRTPVNIPGTLHGVSHAGELLYTVGIHWTTNQMTDWTEWLDAAAYDGISAALVTSLALPDAWPHPVLVVDTNIFIGHPGYSYVITNVVAHRVESWTLTDAGNFTLLGSATVNSAANSLLDLGGLLAVQETDNSLALFDDTQPASLPKLGQGSSPGCLWFNLDQADGAPGRGLWLPLGAYGVGVVPLGP